MPVSRNVQWRFASIFSARNANSKSLCLISVNLVKLVIDVWFGGLIRSGSMWDTVFVESLLPKSIYRYIPASRNLADAKSTALILVQHHEELNRERRQAFVMRQDRVLATQRVSSSNSQGRRTSGGPGTVR